MRVGADSGGTFTDVVGDDGRIAKVPSTPDDPGAAVRSGIDALDAGRPAVLAHGTTVATNALLQRRVGRVALVTTEGLADIIEIARQNRPSLYDPWADRPVPLVARNDRLEVAERLAADGTVLVAYEPGTAPEIPDGVDAVAVCLLHADIDPRHEAAVAEDLATVAPSAGAGSAATGSGADVDVVTGSAATGSGADVDVVLSHQVSPEFREYERTVTTVVNAALRPVCAPYLSGMAGAGDEVAVMTSAGTLVDLDRAAGLPAALLLSGPAAGARAAAQVAAACGHPDAIGFDMGGTSTDVCLVLDGTPAMAAQHEVGGLPIRLPSLDVHTVGAGGGSIARLDPGGALVVGPESAGAVPGPVCYGRGGTRPTVTDADLVAGRIPEGTAFGPLGVLDTEGSRSALEGAGITAEGVIEVVNATMVQALRRVSVERGVDPGGLALVAFGGAGPMHACELAADLGAAAVIVPAAAGVLSAVGLLTSPRGIELVRSRAVPDDHDGIDETLGELAEEARSVLGREALVEHLLDCRYAGQSHELRVGSVEEFHDEHRRRNGYDRRGDVVEVTAVRVVATLGAPATIDELCAGWVGRWGDEEIVGPQVVAREDCTIWVPEGWVGREAALGALELRRVRDVPHGEQP